jgi:hypothetical protein
MKRALASDRGSLSAAYSFFIARAVERGRPSRRFLVLAICTGARASASTTTGCGGLGTEAQRAPLKRAATAASTASPRNRSDHFAAR